MRKLLPIIVVLLASCASKESPPEENASARDTEAQVDVLNSSEAAKSRPTFQKYWYQGEAELNRYELKQARYGEIRDGEAVFIFVTEPFLPEEQVKHEHGDRSDAVSVLKLNAHRRFYTGIYPYNIMTSTFSPVEDTSPMKVTSSTLEWCGQAYVQLNLRDGRYQGTSHSYFQDEADQKFDIEKTVLEDGIFSRIRRDPTTLPTGEVAVVPAMHYLRLMHKPFAVQKAKATLEEGDGSSFNDAATKLYRIDYSGLERTFEVEFEADFPHRIVEWREIYPGFDGEELTTEAELTRSIMLDYWNKNGKKHDAYRKALGLDFAP